MNDSRKIRLLTGIVIGLVVLNIGLLSWFLLRSETQRHRSGRVRSDTFLADTLGFDTQQRQQLAALQETYLREVRPRQRQLRQLRKTYFRLADSSFTTAQREEKALAFHRQSADVELQTLAHFDKVAAITRPAQRRLLNQLLSELPRRSFRAPNERGGRRNNNRTGKGQ
ncbi:MAG: hypothetical protein H7319_15330 [Spirosoma sp.]|nr:hypothetical protein [Spirosoma sp.]